MIKPSGEEVPFGVLRAWLRLAFLFAFLIPVNMLLTVALSLFPEMDGDVKVKLVRIFKSEDISTGCSAVSLS